MTDKANRVSELRFRLREALNKREMKASELSKKTGVPEGAISYYLAGKSQPKGDRLYTMCAALSVSEAWMLGYDIPMERTAEQKKNDDLVKIIAQMRKDPKFYEVVSKMAELPSEQYDSLTTIISALGKK
jgi:transcriptional regulator with XRE-family HTH domain